MPFLANILDSVGLGAILAILATGYYVLSTAYLWYRLHHVPGPFLASLSYIWLGRQVLNGTQLEAIGSATKKYGSLVRIGPNELLTDDPEVVKRMSSAKSKYWKSDWYSGSRFNPYYPTMFITLDPAAHDKIKARMTPGYSGRDNPGAEADVDAQVKSLIGLIREKYIGHSDKGEFRPLNLAEAVSFFTVDVVSKIALGNAFGSLESDSDCHEFYGTVSKHIPQMAFTADVPWARDIVYSTLGLKLFGPKETDPKGIGKVMGLVNKAVRKLFIPGADREEKTLLGSFVRNGLPQSQCEVETLFMFAAGSDTTAAGIRGTLLYLLSAPQVYRKLKDEISSAVQGGKVSSPITYSEARGLPYLQAVIYEGLRIRPVTSSMLAKEVPRGGDIIDGKFIPGGTSIGTNFLMLLRSKEVFGEDADFFRPERYLEADQGTRAEMKRHVELMFGYGRWICSGKLIALMELNKIYFELLRYFDFQLLDPQAPMSTLSHGLLMDKGLLVRVTESTT
ncbi:cytochrome P450 [Daldinia caldariorum]|uniref:cytochrome P450 n=1 Tax=Daldinia caldariorum TaxID=326644 RepID=UPI0020085A2B|nr:cytochrome P450 [Daldinia caldariorum]KAI1473040.1 cytochrome P450 [Daldinia caldariorum]